MLSKARHSSMRLLPMLMVAVVVAVALAACSGSGRRSTPYVDVNKDFNRLYENIVTSADLSHADSMIAKAYDGEDISEGQRRYLEAMVVYKSLARFDTVLEICQKALDAPDTRSDKMLNYCVYSLMASAACASQNNAAMLQYASRTEALAKELGITDKEYEMKAIVGYGMVVLGRIDEGLSMIDDAIEKLKKDNTWNATNSLLIASKMKVAALDRINRPRDIQQVCTVVIDQLDRLMADPDAIKEKPAAWVADSASFAMQLQLYRTQMLAYLSYAYAAAGDRAEALECLKQFDASEQSKTLDCQRMIVSALGELKLFDRMLGVYSRIDREDGADTITESYSEELDMKARAAEAMGDYTAARHYLRRDINLNDTLHKVQDMDQMAHTLSVYKVHDEQMKAQRANAAAKLMLVAVIALVVIVVLAAVYMLRLYRQKQTMALKNKALISSIDKSLEYKDKYENLIARLEEESDNLRRADAIVAEARGFAPAPTATADPDAETPTDENAEAREDRRLYELIDRTMREGHLYLNPDFQRQTIVEILHADRNRIGRAIRDYSGFSNLSTYINNYRLEYAYRLLRDMDSRQTIDAIAKSSGFSTVRTFQRLFKERYGMTPVEFRESYCGISS